MSHARRFWIGGAGALLPLLVTLLAIDLANIIDHYRDYSFGTYVGTALRYLVLFGLGGVVAALNSDEIQPIKLVQLGIAAPALIASYVNAQPPKTQTVQYPPAVNSQLSLSFVARAHAGDAVPERVRSFQMAGGFLSDVAHSIGNTLPNIKQSAELNKATVDAIRKAEEEKKAAEDLKAEAARLVEVQKMEAARMQLRLEELKASIKDASKAADKATEAATRAASASSYLDRSNTDANVQATQSASDDARKAAIATSESLKRAVDEIERSAAAR